MSNMNAIAEFGKSLMAFANLFTVLIFFQAAWQDSGFKAVLIGCILWLIVNSFGILLILLASSHRRA